ncbi:hypothetical protein QYE76_048230 [Lolium multiflorum]|uniref:Knottins-like domain-containing protein n=1 Tax=Lolium multiflorum TaxID=4521 RepID=A0AAD8Q3A6_LOLMU|nr:hypothetical protein QYE76_048230 [Lolium multiflorum]
MALRMGGGERWREDPAISGADAVAVADLAVGGADAVGSGAMGKVFITGRRPLKYRRELGTTTVAEARTCLSQSHNFKGACLSSTNCASVCRTENFPDGDCKTRRFQRKCFCIKNC